MKNREARAVRQKTKAAGCMEMYSPKMAVRLQRRTRRLSWSSRDKIWQEKGMQLVTVSGFDLFRYRRVV